MSQSLNILFGGSLNKAKTKTQIQRDLNSIGKDVSLRIAGIDQASLRKINADLKRVEKQYAQLGKTNVIDGNRIKKQVDIASKGMNDATKSSNDLGKSINTTGDAFMKFAKWFAIGTLFAGGISAGRELVSVIADINKEIITMRKVSGDTLPIESVMNNAIEASNKYAQGLREVTAAYSELAKQGNNAAQIELLGNTALLMSTVADIEKTDDAVKYLTGTIYQMNMEWSESTKILDSWNELSNTTPATAEEIAKGFMRSAQSAANAGLDYNELSGVIATLEEVTKRGGAQIGNSLKTIFARQKMDGVTSQ
ncbi:phage tail tape measure protein, partial [Alkalihalobacillus sp. NPDC127517]